MKKIASLLTLMVMTLSSFAQDKIYLKTQKAPVEGEVTEVSVNEIKYKPFGRPNPIITIDKQDVMKIVYQNGEVFMIQNPMQDFSLYNGQKKYDLKLDVLSPLAGYTRLYLEKAEKPGRSHEFELNVIGLGKTSFLYSQYNPGTGGSNTVNIDQQGIGIGYGKKFLRTPDYVNGQLRLRHILQGSYVKPAISLAYYSRNFMYYDRNVAGPGGGGDYKTVRKPVYSANLAVTFGKQWILDNTLSIEIYATAGYGIDNVRSTGKKTANDNGGYSPFMYENEPYNNFGAIRFSKGDFGLTLNGGFRVGYLFNWNKKGEKK